MDNGGSISAHFNVFLWYIIDICDAVLIQREDINMMIFIL